MHPTPPRLPDASRHAGVRARRRVTGPDDRLRVDPDPVDDGDFPELATHRPVAAGHVLAVMLVALVLGALLNADRMVERAEQRSFDDPWRAPSLAVWGGVESVADAVGLTQPREAIETAIGRDGDDDGAVDVDELLASRRTETPETGDAPAGTPRTPDASTTTTIEAAPVEPDLRTPSAAQPLRLYVGGDSMAKNFGIAMQSVAGSTGIVESTIDYRLVSGLARPDFFDWPRHLAETVVPADPEVVILLFGANDAQSLRLPDGSICQRFERCWIDEYRRRVAGTMDLLEDPDNDRLVLWLGQPIMGPSTGVRYVDLFNAIYEDEADDRSWVRYVDTWSWFSRPDGSYSAYLDAADGTEHRVRDGDDVHLSAAGGERLSWALLRLLGQEHVDLSAWPGTPPAAALPGELPPPRTELSPPEPIIVD